MRCKVNNNNSDAFYATSERLFYSLLPVLKLSHVFFYSSHKREKPALLRAFSVIYNQKKCGYMFYSLRWSIFVIIISYSYLYDLDFRCKGTMIC